MPIAEFRHYGRVGKPIYFGFASNGAIEFLPGQFLYVQPGRPVGLCPQHSMEPPVEMAKALQSFMAHLWVHVGGSDLGNLNTIRLTANEADFIESVKKDVPSKS